MTFLINFCNNKENKITDKGHFFCKILELEVIVKQFWKSKAIFVIRCLFNNEKVMIVHFRNRK